MSHFALVVITKTNDEAELESALQKFHEFECTGIDDEYVKDLDKTQEALDTYAKSTETRLKGPDGKLHSYFDEEGAWCPEFSIVKKDNPLWDAGRRERFIPPGFEEVEVPTSEVESFTEWAEGYYGWKVSGKVTAEELKYGYIQIDGTGEVIRCIKRTNENKQWDWWVIGGRYRGKLRRRGEHVDIDKAQKCQLDLDAMRKENVIRRLSWITPVYEKIREKLPNATSEEIAILFREQRDIVADRRKEWESGENGPFYEYVRKSERFKELNSLGIGEISSDFGAGVPETVDDPIAWANNAPPLTAFAFLGTDGVWHEKGDMGWFGMVADEKDEKDWETQFQELFDTVPDNHWITIVDCHI